MRMCITVLLFSAIGLWAQKTIKEVPVQQTPTTSGVQMFKAYCASCHGISGKGNGPAASALKKAPADLTMLAHNNNGKYPEGMVANTLRLSTESVHGSSEMPVWGTLLSSLSNEDRPQTQLRIQNIANYIQTLQVK